MERLVEVAGQTWNVAESGAGEGETLLLVHGFPLDHSMWDAQLEGMASQFRVVAPDLPGFGASHAVEGTVAMSQFADGIASLLDAMQIDGPIHFCGLSMGGYIGWEFWRRHCNRLRSLIQVDTRAAADSPEVARARQMVAASVVRDGSRSVTDPMIQKLFAKASRERIPTVVESTRRVMASTEPSAIAAAQRGMSERFDFVELLSTIETRSILICGEHDSISPPDEMRSIAEAMPNATYVQIEDAGHLAPLEQPQAFNNALIAFLPS